PFGDSDRGDGETVQHEATEQRRRSGGSRALASVVLCCFVAPCEDRFSVNLRYRGSAKTKIAFAFCAIFFSGVSSAGIVVTHWPRRAPAGTARYCLPFTA